MRRETISTYSPDYRMRNTTHYVTTNRKNVICTVVTSKRDASEDAAIFDKCDRKNAPHKVYRYTGTSGEISALDV